MNAEATAKELSPIWPEGVKIEVLGLTGEYNTGKTLFGLFVDPEHARVYDFEKSSGSYEQGLGFERVDVPSELQKLYPQGYSGLDVFKWWRADVLKLSEGAYSVLMADPVTDIESGMVDWVESRYKEYGFSSKDKFRATGGVFWGKVKEEWKLLLSQVAARCQTFVFTAHLRSKWVAGKKTSKMEPKGKDTLMELSSLYLWLNREADAKGKVPEKPNAIVKKSRLAAVKLVDGEPVAHPLLPPTFKDATPQRIRQYIESPPDYAKLKPDEKIKEPQMTEDERLQIEAQVAEDKRVAEETLLQRLERQAELQEQHRQAVESQRPQNPDQSQDGAYREQVKTNVKKSMQAEKTFAPMNGDESGGEPKTEGAASVELIATLVEFKTLLAVPNVEWKRILHGRCNSENPADLSEEDCKNLIAQFRAIKAKRDEQKANEVPF